MRLLALGLSLFVLACGPKPTTMQDAGPDTSCGLDCVAQARYGLIVERCFEYSSDPLNAQDPPTLGAWVRPVFTLEGGVKVIPVEYRQNGQIRMIDSFSIVDGNLRLMRREFAGTGQSVTYKTGMDITGVQWLTQGSSAGETYTSSTDAFIANQSSTMTVPTTYRMTTAAASASELRTPLETYTSGLKLLVGETPDHGSDPRRVYVPDVGFVVLASSFSLVPGTTVAVSLQKIRDIGSPDGGSDACSLGRP
ncbi:MAG: hypothetical protein IT380_11350 [Myxococcales bacterium]|nr:hypothetical protein [Myxococcales bacterium]